MNPPQRALIRGFSLIELLTVVALLGVLAVAAVPAVSQLGKAGRDSQNLILVSGTLEKAREYAVSRNTYTWVSFQKLKSDPEQPVYMMAFASADGSKAGVTSGGTYAIGSSAADLVAIDRPQKLENCSIEADLPAENVLGSKLPSTSSLSFLAGAGTGPTFDYSSPRLPSADTKFSHSVMFTPAGEARVSAALPESVQMVMVPLKGGTVVDNAAASVIRVSGLTGRVKVYRP